VEEGAMAPGGGVPVAGRIGESNLDALDVDRSLLLMGSTLGKLELKTEMEESSSSILLLLFSISEVLLFVFHGGGDVARKLEMLLLCSANCNISYLYKLIV
jgi:hypothetical protein